MESSQILQYAQIPSFTLAHPDFLVQQPFTESFPRAEIYEILTPDLLHQLIKGAFKDHLVHWVIGYFGKVHTAREAKRIKDIIDRRCVFLCNLSLSHDTVLITLDSISLAPPFPGLRRFKDGRNFSQWTGNDSKALMKVRVPLFGVSLPTVLSLCCRSGCPQSKASFQKRSSRHSVHSSTFTTSSAGTCSTKTTSSRFKTPSTSSMPPVQYSNDWAFGMSSRFHASIP